MDPITATALALDGGSDRALMVSLDVISIPAKLMERVRSRLKTALPEFDGRYLLLNATHTHTAPDLDGVYEIPAGVTSSSEYLEFLTGAVTDAAVRAWGARRPAGVSWAVGQAVVGQNRRVFYGNGRSVIYGQTNRADFMGFEGSADPALELLFFWTPERKLTGIGINVACPSQVLERQYSVSADFWHEVRIELRRRYGNGVFIFPMTGAAGDQAPRSLVRKAAEARLRQRLGISETVQIARRIARAVEEVYPAAASDIRFEAPFAHRVEELKLPERQITEAEMKRVQAEYERAEKAPATDPKRHATMQWTGDVIERYRRQDAGAGFVMELHVVRLGDVALATNPFELFLDFGLRMKARSRAEQTFVIQLACGDGSYLPTAKALAAGGYGAEVTDNLVGPEGGQMLVDRTVVVINSLFR